MGILFLLLLAPLTTGDSESVYIFPEPEELDILEHPFSSAPSKVHEDDVVVELAIFYDHEFALRLNNDPAKIQQYWEVVMYDLHLRFQTLSSFRTSFRVTSLQIYQKNVSEAIQDDLRGSHALYFMGEDFKTFAYSQRNRLPSFDIAILALGDPSFGENMVRIVEAEGTICRAHDKENRKWLASTVITLQAFPSPPEVLAVHIAKIMGAPSDDDPKHFDICNASQNTETLCCMLGTSRPIPQIVPKFFSKCSDLHLSLAVNTLKKDNVFCMGRRRFGAANVVIDSGKLFQNPSQLHAFTMLEQCKILARDNTTDLDVEVASCVEVFCVDKTTKQRLFKFTPLEGTFCGEDHAGRCFRAICVQNKVQLRNVANEKCLVSEGYMFAENDKPIFQNCSKVVTQKLIDHPVITSWDGQEDLVLGLLFSGPNGPSYKFLGRNVHGGGRRFCSGQEECIDTRLTISRLSSTGGKEFVLEMDQMRRCLKASKDGENLMVTDDCSGEDKGTRWEFVEMNQGSELGKTCGSKELIAEEACNKEPASYLRKRVEL